VVVDRVPDTVPPLEQELEVRGELFVVLL